MFRVTRKGWALRLGALLVCILMVFSVNVWAAEKSYHISKANFDITINDDGSANIVETWLLNYEGNSFSRFYKDIYADLPKDEMFTEIEDLQVSIDGIPCKLTDHPDERPEETYFFEKDGDAYRISAFRNSTSVTEYVFSYKLTKVVKNVDNDYNLFIYRPIGADFKKPVDSVEVHIHTPEGSVPKILYCTQGKSVINRSDVNIYAKDCEGMYRIRIRMDGADIPGAVPIRSKELSERKSLLSRILNKIIPKLLAVIALVALPLGLKVQTEYWPKYRDQKKYRRFLEHPELFDEKLQIIKAHMKPAELSLFMSDLYLYEFAYLVQLDKIRLDDQNFWLTRDPEGLDGYAKVYYNFVLGHIRLQSDTEHKDEWYYVDYEAYGLYVEDSYESVVSYYDILKNSSKNKLKERKEYNQIRSAIKVVADYSRLMWERKCLYDIIKDEQDPYIMALSISNSTFVSRTDKGSSVDDFIYYYTDELRRNTGRMYIHYANAKQSGSTGSSYSSYSSCSSCSSCGGGGAD